jgi:hypothetical protein
LGGWSLRDEHPDRDADGLLLVLDDGSEGVATLMKNALDALPPESSELIKSELANVNSDLLEQFGSGQHPTNEEQ